MKIFIALLRGINVLGKNKVKMEELRGVLGKSGLEDPQTYIQSGNVIFRYRNEPVKEIASLIHKTIRDHFGYDIPVVVLSNERLQKIISENPFVSEPEKDISRLHVTFLGEEPAEKDWNNLLRFDHPPDEIRQGNKVVYLYCPDGYARTKFNNEFLEKKLKVAATTRNWRSTTTIQEMGRNIKG